MNTSDTLDRATLTTPTGAPPLRLTTRTASCRRCGRVLSLLDDEVSEVDPICWTCDHDAE